MRQWLYRTLEHCFLIILVGSAAFGIDPAKHISQYAHTAWRTREGTFSGIPVAITQTADGYLWVGTNINLVRFDGVRFTPWTPQPGQRPSDPRAYSLVGGRDGSLWIGTGYGIDRLKDGKLEHYPQINGRIESVIEDAAGTVWLVRTQSTDGKGPLCSIKDNQVDCYGTASGIPFPLALQVQNGGAGDLWVAGYDELCRWSAGSCTIYFGGAHRRPETFASLRAIAAAANGSVWAAIDQPARILTLQRFEHGQWSKQDFPAIKVNNGDITALFVDRDNLLWVGTAHHGIWRIRGNEIDHYGNTDGLSSDAVGRFYQDVEGTVWVVTAEGIDNFRDLRVTSFSSAEGLSAAGASSVVAAHDGTVWVGNFRALDALRGYTISGIRMGQGLPGVNVTTLLEDHAGRLWVGIDDGLWVYENHQFQAIRRGDGRGLGIVFALAEDIDHSIWVRAGPKNLDHIENLKLKAEITSPQISSAYALAADPRGGVVMGLVNGDLVRYADGKAETLTRSGAANGRQIRDMLIEPGGSIWATTLDGAFYFKNGVRNDLTTRNGLPCDEIFALVKDARGALWLYTRCGLVAIEKTQLDNWVDHPGSSVKFELFDALDGVLPGLTSLKPQTARSPDGRLWFVNGRLLQMIDPDRLHLNELPPPVHIEEVLADHKSFTGYGSLRLPALTHDLEIKYAGLSFVAPEKVRFLYKLEGRDKAWQDPGTRRQAFYSDLSPGNYTFRVVAANNEGVWNEAGANLKFSVAPAWFQTRWFRALCIVSLLLIAWAIYRLRVRQVVKELSARFDERLVERTRMARELHDTFLQTIQGSKFVADDALEHVDDPVRTRHALEKLSDWLGRANQEGRAALHSLRSSTTETNDLAAAFRRALDDCRRETSIETSFDMTGDAREMHPVVRDEVYRIGYEAIRNACIHSACSRVDVALSYAENLSVKIRDNGVGIDSAIVETGRNGHFGLQGMRERAARIGARLRIASSSGSGTEVNVVVPGRIVFQRSRPTPLDRIRTLVKGAHDQ